jgi:hypothetical protein
LKKKQAPPLQKRGNELYLGDRRVEEWSFEMVAVFRAANGGLLPGLTNDKFYVSPNNFSIDSLQIDNASVPPTPSNSFSSVLYPGGIVVNGIQFPAEGGTLKSKDVWHVTYTRGGSPALSQKPG